MYCASIDAKTQPWEQLLASFFFYWKSVECNRNYWFSSCLNCNENSTAKWKYTLPQNVNIFHLLLIRILSCFPPQKTKCFIFIYICALSRWLPNAAKIIIPITKRIKNKEEAQKAVSMREREKCRHFFSGRAGKFLRFIQIAIFFQLKIVFVPHYQWQPNFRRIFGPSDRRML